ncbi:hypothetical protein GS501_06270 [Saccharibacter sp. 17.LH.SD]|uniref:Hint domain-containing protein n=1 Tax=Saccharibacter sp. 17.LH.SD TaxID=2689393 RepID=UPI00136FC6C3|nr:Hint domain-containing protein [Saccharibacter sp. 17.LH.SD]MXV44649.1 hypothetical protein [Saccharibacter sp. 17.LH.SD]
MDSEGDLSAIYTDVTMTFNGSHISLKAPDGSIIDYNYDFSWGNKVLNEFIIGNGAGGYYVVAQYPDELQGSYSYSYSPDFSQNQWTKVASDGNSYIFSQDDGGTATGGQINSGGDTPFMFDPCFLGGTLIDTPRGHKKIDELEVGDLVVSYDYKNSVQSTEKIIWMGQGHKIVHAHWPLDLAGYPIRILKNALSEGVPFKDLLVTPEHCVFHNGTLIPARMLVNGASIYFDISFTEYDYYHIETEKHSILLSDGMFTESYLDTGNRDHFKHSKGIHRGKGAQEANETGMAAPLCTERHDVEALHGQLIERAKQLGFPFLQNGTREPSEDPNFFLVTNKGDIIREARYTGAYRVFSIPDGVKFVELFSKASRPSDVIGPFVDDRRDLGLLIGEIKYFKPDIVDEVDIHLKRERLYGWSVLEEGRYRWMTGKAVLPLPEPHGEGGILAFQICAGGPYA